jgi:hypothetical protein
LGTRFARLMVQRLQGLHRGLIEAVPQAIAIKNHRRCLTQRSSIQHICVDLAVNLVGVSG